MHASFKQAGNLTKNPVSLVNHLRANHADLLADITDNDRKVKDDLADAIKAALDTYAADFA